MPLHCVPRNKQKETTSLRMVYFSTFCGNALPPPLPGCRALPASTKTGPRDDSETSGAGRAGAGRFQAFLLRDGWQHSALPRARGCGRPSSVRRCGSHRYRKRKHPRNFASLVGEKAGVNEDREGTPKNAACDSFSYNKSGDAYPVLFLPRRAHFADHSQN